MSTQLIRASQIITTYGPGAIVEAPGGPGVMRDIDGSGVFGADPVADFEISDIRLSKRLGGVGLVRIPTNSERNLPDQEGIYASNAFPEWSLCVRHENIYQYTDHVGGCPDCPRGREDKPRSRAEAIRFLLACPDGHMDDLDWPRLMNHRDNRCPPRYLKWQGGGGALRNVRIVCPVCNEGVNLSRIYTENSRCSGRQPEIGNARPGCPTRARVLQRNAANLRIADLATSLTIPRNDTILHGLLASRDIQLILATNRPQSKSDLLTYLENAGAMGLASPLATAKIASYSDAEIKQAMDDVLGVLGSAAGTEEFRLAELIQLERAAVEGAPPSNRDSADPPLFEVVRNAVRTIAGPNGYTLRITPVTRLRVTMAQVGYRRIDPANSRQVPTLFSRQGRDWIPAIGLSGEGIFIDAVDSVQGNRNNIDGPSEEAWRNRWRNPLDFEPVNLTELGPDGTHPLLVWWHTLSHRLITSLALDSGYSAAALRERLYVNLDPNAGLIRGGILIFTSQPGGDGTLGGLVESVGAFEDVLARSLDNLAYCSNDPLCSAQLLINETCNGSACYACLLISETSCELRNTSLDRNLLLGNLP